jgi:heptosyltransferase III
MKGVKTIIISRTDSIGDVVLTLPIAHVLKHKFPNCKIIFLGKSYTKPVLECCVNIDQIVCWDEINQFDNNKLLNFFSSLNADCVIHVFPNKQVAVLAKKTGIPIRIGTSHRLFHWLTCNKLPNFTRKNSDLHEAQLNFKLLEPLGIEINHSLISIQGYFGFTQIKPLKNELSSLIDKDRYNLILHPKSKGSAQEWGFSNFSKLLKLLPKDRFKIFITGTKQEGSLLKPILAEHVDVVDMTGKMSLSELISFINNCDGLVAASTGPLHISAALGKKIVGIYSSIRPIHPGRWAPIGKNANYLTSKITCSNCMNGKRCECISTILPQEVLNVLMNRDK